jgi:Spy/CpxP family protein refolding chaperone
MKKLSVVITVLLIGLGTAVAQTPRFPVGRWWQQPFTVQKLGLTEEQQKKIDDVFQQNRVKLIDLTAALDREEAIMEPMMGADPPDAAKIRTQIDRVAQARAELEKANANMLVGIRMLLTAEQWQILQGNVRTRRGPGGSPVPMPKKGRIDK